MKTRILLALLLTCLTLSGEQARLEDPQYTSDGRLIRPEHYREWIYLSSGLGMTYGFLGAAANALVGQRFDNVFVTPQAYSSFLQSGTWPDKTMFVKEVRASASKGSLNKGGQYQDGVVAIEVHVKDRGRFPTESEFFVFDAGNTATPAGAGSSCASCHSQHGVVGDTFVQFYPTLLPVAKAKGTLKAQ